jgi:hypothetical protein
VTNMFHCVAICGITEVEVMSMSQGKRARGWALLSFEAWMRLVDRELLMKCGMDSRDLADCSYLEWYEDGDSPKAAASKALRMNGGGL